MARKEQTAPARLKKTGDGQRDNVRHIDQFKDRKRRRSRRKETAREKRAA
jgi:hypothetical protein